MANFNLVHFTRELYRRSPPWFISGAICAVLLAASQVIYYTSRAMQGPETAMVVKVADRQVKPEEEIQPPEKIDRNIVPKTNEPELIDYDAPEDQVYIPEEQQTFIKTDEDMTQEQGDPRAIENLPSGTTGGTAIGVGTEGHYGIRPSAFSGPAGGKYGNRFASRGKAQAGGGGGTEQSLKDGLDWLRAHQSADGSWDCDGFMSNCGKIAPGSICDGPGESTHDVGMTGLSLLAFMGDGNTTVSGPNKELVAKGVKWLKDQQDPELGVLGERVGKSFLYNHAIGTLALCEAYYFGKSPFIRRCTQDAINFVTRARNPYSAWRYEYPPSGENDTSVTGWMIMALKSAEDGGLTIDKEAFTGALSWFDEVTDTATGRTGYDSIGSKSSRQIGVNEQYPPEKGEAMTAVAILCRFFMGQEPSKNPIMEKGAELLRAKPPVYDPDGLGNDFYYWYYGSYAMYQMGGSQYWDPWRKALEKAIVGSQRKDGDTKGSWDPKDAWGHAGGRIYTTALGALCCEVYFRYARVLGAR